MSSFIGAALPWMGGKMADLLGFQGEGGGSGAAVENTGGGTPMDESSGKSEGDVISANQGSAAHAQRPACNGVSPTPRAHSGNANNSQGDSAANERNGRAGGGGSSSWGAGQRKPSVSSTSPSVANGKLPGNGYKSVGSGVLRPARRVRHSRPSKEGSSFMVQPSMSSSEERRGRVEGEAQRQYPSPRSSDSGCSGDSDAAAGNGFAYLTQEAIRPVGSPSNLRMKTCADDVRDRGQQRTNDRQRRRMAATAAGGSSGDGDDMNQENRSGEIANVTNSSSPHGSRGEDLHGGEDNASAQQRVIRVRGVLSQVCWEGSSSLTFASKDRSPQSGGRHHDYHVGSRQQLKISGQSREHPGPGSDAYHSSALREETNGGCDSHSGSSIPRALSAGDRKTKGTREGLLENAATATGGVERSANADGKRGSSSSPPDSETGSQPAIYGVGRQRRPEAFPPPSTPEGSGLSERPITRSKEQEKCKRNWCWKTHEILHVDHGDDDANEKERLPHRETEVQAEEVAQRFQRRRFLPSLVAPQSPVSNWPPPAPSKPPASHHADFSPLPQHARGPESILQRNMGFGRDGGGGSPVPGAFNIGVGRSPSPLNRRGPVVRRAGPEGAVVPSPAWLAARGSGQDGEEAPVFSNGVLVPRPFLWAGNGNGTKQSNTPAPAAAPQSRLRSGSRDAGGEAHGSEKSGWAAASAGGRSAAAFSSTPRRQSDETMTGTGRGDSKRTATVTMLLPEPSRSSSSASSSSSGSTTQSSEADPAGRNATAVAGGGGGRLAWIGDQRQLLQRPSATLQLRRHTAAASGVHSQLATAAAYLGRLDLVAAAKRRNANVGNRSASGGVASVTGQLRNSSRWSAGAGSHSRGSRNGLAEGRGTGRGVANSSSSTDDGVTISSSGVSVTSGEGSDIDEEQASFVSGASRDDHGKRDDGAKRASKDRGTRHHQAAPWNGRQQRGPISVATVAAEAVAVTAAANANGNSGTRYGDGNLDYRPVASARSTHSQGSAAASGNRKKRKIHGGKSAQGIAAAQKKPRMVACDAHSDTSTCQSADSMSTLDEWDGPTSSTASLSDGGASRKETTVKDTPSTDLAPPDSTRFTPRPRSRSRRKVGEPIVPPPPPNGPRKWPARPPHRALVYAAAAEASRRARGFSGWLFPSLPPPPPPPPSLRPLTLAPLPPPAPVVIAPPPVEVPDGECAAGSGEVIAGGGSNPHCGEEAPVEPGETRRRRRKWMDEGVFLGFARDNPPGKPSPNEFGWLPLDPMLTPEGRKAAKQRAIERVAERKRQAILEALRIKEEVAEARRKRKLNILFLGMTRVAEYDCMGGLAKGKKRFDIIERRVRQDVDETNMNPLRDTARVLAMEALGHEVRCVSKVATPGESDSEKARSTRAKGGPTGLGRFLATDMTNTGASRGFVRRIEEKWENTTFDTVLLDHYWLPDSVVWLNKGYMANDGGLIQNLVRMTNTRLLREDFEIMLPINQAFFELLLPHFKDLETHFTVEFLVGERLEHLKKSHLALEADELIPAEVMLNIYGKEREHQVSQMLGVKQPTADVAAILLRYGVAAQHFCYARFLKLTRNPAATAAYAASSTAAEAAKNAQATAAAQAAASTAPAAMAASTTKVGASGRDARSALGLSSDAAGASD